MSSLTREAELALLIAEQEKDDTDRVYGRAISLDQPLGVDADSATFHDFIGTDFFGEGVGTTWDEGGKDEGVSDKDIAYWKYLHFKAGWSKTRIAEHVGVNRFKVARWIKKRHRRDSAAMDWLEAYADVLTAAYARGAKLIEVAADVYQEAGYSSPESCYQALRLVFIDRKVPMRTSRLVHGMRSGSATRKQRNEYQRQQHSKRSQRRGVSRCKSRTKAGVRCSRFGVNGVCGVHAAGPKKWTEEAVREALTGWREQHGRWPQAKEWTHAKDGHPNFKTVYAVFGSWTAALSAAQDGSPLSRISPGG